MKKVLAMAGVALSPLALVLSASLPKVGLLLLTYLPTFLPALIAVVLPLLVVGILGLLGTTVSDSVLFLL